MAHILGIKTQSSMAGYKQENSASWLLPLLLPLIFFLLIPQ